MIWNDRYVDECYGSYGADISVETTGSQVIMLSFVRMKSCLKLYTKLWPLLTMYVLSFPVHIDD
jgi:hypothetical protein